MKTREGFVSNSSSTSFVVLLPKDYKLPDTASSQATKMFDYLKNTKAIWAEEVDNLLPDEDDASEYYDELVELLYDYIVAEVNVSSDGGQLVLGENKNEK